MDRKRYGVLNRKLQSEKTSSVLFSILLMYVLQFEDGSYIFYSIIPIPVGRCYFQTETCNSER